MFEISVEETFAAGHALRGYKGKCENVHGHNYKVQVHIEGQKLDSTGLVMDFVEVKRILHEVVDTLDHKFMNDVPPFDVLNPSAENMSKYFHDEIAARLSQGVRETPVRLVQVRIWETETSTATYRP